MMRILTGFSALLLCTVGPLVFSADPLVFPAEVELGPLVPGEKVTATLTGRNQSKKTVYIERIRTDCGCSVAEFDSAGIAPGAETRVQVGYTPGARIGERRRSVRIYLKECSQPAVVTLTGTVSRPAGEDPLAADPGRLPAVHPAPADDDSGAYTDEAAAPGLAEIPPGPRDTVALHPGTTAGNARTSQSLRAEATLLSTIGAVFIPNLLLLGVGTWALRRKGMI